MLYNNHYFFELLSTSVVDSNMAEVDFFDTLAIGCWPPNLAVLRRGTLGMIWSDGLKKYAPVHDIEPWFEISCKFRPVNGA